MTERELIQWLDNIIIEGSLFEDQEAYMVNPLVPDSLEEQEAIDYWLLVKKFLENNPDVVFKE